MHSKLSEWLVVAGDAVYLHKQTPSLFHWKYFLCFKHYKSYITPWHTVLQMLTKSPYAHFPRSTDELRVNWAADGPCLNFQGGSFTFHLKTSPSRSERAVSSQLSPGAGRDPERFSSSLQCRVRKQWARGNWHQNTGAPWLQDGLLPLQSDCVRAEGKPRGKWTVSLIRMCESLQSPSEQKYTYNWEPPSLCSL